MTDLPERISGRRPIGGDVLVQCDFIGWDADNIEVPKSDTLFLRADTAIPRAEAKAIVAAAYLDAEDALASADQEQADDGITWGDMSQIVDAIASSTPADARADFEKAVQEAVEAALQQATLFCTDCGHPVPAGPDGRGSCGHGRVMRISTLVQHEIGGKND